MSRSKPRRNHYKTSFPPRGKSRHDSILKSGYARPRRQSEQELRFPREWMDEPLLWSKPPEPPLRALLAQHERTTEAPGNVRHDPVAPVPNLWLRVWVTLRSMVIRLIPCRQGNSKKPR